MGSTLSRLRADFIISSHCREPIQLRSQRDLLNALYLFNMTPDRAQKVLNKCEEVVMRGQSRQTFKGILAVENKLKRKGDELLPKRNKN